MRLRNIAAAALVMGAVSAAGVSAQKIDPAFTKAREARTKALREGDKATFDKYTAETFIVTDASGRVENKAERGARVVPPANPPQGQPAPLMNEKITPYANGNVIVLTWQANQQGMPTHFLEVWVKEKGDWKVGAVQVSRPVPAGDGRGEGRGEGRRGEGRRGGQ
jgi:ABC-type Fe3+-hydroxamate transport system substrate-binding protein